MGSRSYTKQVVDAIDPERKIFTSKVRPTPQKGIGLGRLHRTGDGRMRWVAATRGAASAHGRVWKSNGARAPL
eukprot:1717683-Prymnesium_polylepis.2